MRRWAPLAAGLLVLACQADPAPPGERTHGHAEAAQVRIGAIDWYVDYDAALEIAKAQDKALWVHFGENPG